ncbi:hypothetical protein F3157_17545 [Virgibacillus dakarensis]|nr:hypothetical protein [Virgibacillus dakarensis]
MLNNLKGKAPSIFMMLFGILVILMIPSQIKEVGNEASKVGANFFPYMIAILIVFLSIISIIKDGKETYEKEAENESKKTSFIQFLMVFISMVLWIYIVPFLGYIITTALFIGGLMWLFGNRNPYQLLLVSISFSLITSYVFVNLLSVNLPEITF